MIIVDINIIKNARILNISYCHLRTVNSYRGARVACWLERRTRDRTVASSNPAGAAGKFFFQSQLCVLTYSVSVLPLMLPQWHVKDPGHSVKSAGGRLHLNTHTPLTRRSRSRLTTPLSRQNVGIYQETSSHATRQGTLGPSRLSSLSHCGLILG